MSTHLLHTDTPWDEPTEKSAEFTAYCINEDVRAVTPIPWAGFSPVVFDIVTGLLNIYEERRATIAMIKQHPWYQR